MSKENISNVIVSVLLVIATITLAVATFQLVGESKRLGDINENLLYISNDQKEIAESQRNIMQNNLELIKPRLRCWWNSTDSGDSSKTKITVINLGQLPTEVNSIYIRQPAIFIRGSEDKDVLNYTLGGTPANIIRGGEIKILPTIISPLIKISTARINTALGEIGCDLLNQSTGLNPISETRS